MTHHFGGRLQPSSIALLVDLSTSRSSHGPVFLSQPPGHDAGRLCP
ncbi:hypothetical protein ABZ419_08655 [Streptomyces cinnamoneus]